MTKIQIAILIVFALLMFDIIVDKHILSTNLKATEERLQIQTQLTDNSINIALQYIPAKAKVKYLDDIMANTKKVYDASDKKK